MKNTPFTNVYKRIKRTTDKTRSVYGFYGESKGFTVYTREEMNNLCCFGRNSIEVPLHVKKRVYDKIMKKVPHEDKEHHNPSSYSPCFPPARLTEEVSRNQIMTSSHMAEVSAEAVPEKLPSPPSSAPRPQARQKRRKKKLKPEDELTDTEVTVPKRVHVRGRTRRSQKNSNTSTNGKGMLDSETFLHYFLHLWNGFPEEMVKSVAYFDPFWFTMYANEKRRSVVLKWIKGKGILSKKYVLVPIVLWSHWSLLIFCHLGESLQSKTNAPCILLLDSLHSIGPKRLEPLIRRLLLDVYNTEERQVSKAELKKIPLLIPKVPQQKKGDECGYYVLQFITLFLENAPEKFNISEGYPYFMNKDWFTVEEMQPFYKKLDSFNVVSNNHDSSASDDSGNCVELIEGSFVEVSSWV